jgi:ABC-type branched-subunit amino acid transport system ATPase component
MLKLSLGQRYLSLEPFEVEVPPLTLITGLNGSGKTQLLRGIFNGHIIAGEERLREGQIVLRAAQDFMMDLPASYSGFSDLATKEEFTRQTAVKNRPLRQKWLEWGVTHGIEEEALKRLTAGQFRFHPAEPSDPAVPPRQTAALIALIDELRPKAFPERIYHSSVNLDHTNILSSAQERTGIPYFLLSEQEVRNSVKPPRDLFTVSLGEIFNTYRDYSLSNKIAQVRSMEGDESATPLTREEFFGQHGRPPWEVLNEILAEMGLDAEFIAPPSTSLTFSEPVLRNGRGETFQPASLSSGEQIILKLAVLGYIARDKNGGVTSPKLVLLDEVDGPLHPAMTRTYLDVISNVLIGQFKLNVIATTHSPSTIAQAQVDQIYVMKKGEPGLSQISTQQAIAILSEGVPTLSVSLDDRRQVFAESPVEAENFERLYAILKPSLASQLSLQFIATGSKQTNSSKFDVERIVGDLIQKGNKSTYGIIDWDLKNRPHERIVVLAEGRRYALENVVLDPVILIAAIYKFKKPHPADYYGLDPSLSVFNLSLISESKWQELADIVTTRVLGKVPYERVQCSYRGGMKLDIDRRYLEHPAHPLEHAIARAFQFFEGLVNSGSGKMTGHMIEEVVVQYPDLLPIEVQEAFDRLLN